MSVVPPNHPGHVNGAVADRLHPKSFLLLLCRWRRTLPLHRAALIWTSGRRYLSMTSVSSTSTFTFLRSQARVKAAEADVVGQPSPPKTTRSCEASASAMASRVARIGESWPPDFWRRCSTAPPLLGRSRFRSSSGPKELRNQRPSQQQAPNESTASRQMPSAGRERFSCRSQTRRCLQRASWPTLARGPEGCWCRRGGQVAAVDRRAAGGVGDVQPSPKSWVSSLM